MIHSIIVIIKKKLTEKYVRDPCRAEYVDLQIHIGLSTWESQVDLKKLLMAIKKHFHLQTMNDEFI